MSANRPNYPNQTGLPAQADQEKPDDEENKAIVRAFIQQENKSPDDFE